jgi:O-methyltransferase involved in polyketide biosynthesis
MLLDNATERFINENNDVVIINIGAGLDTRFKRIKGHYRHWYDLDMPDVIELRRRFFRDMDNYTMIGKSVFDYSWIDDVDSTGKPTLIIAEGILMYFEECEVRELFGILAERFPGAEMLFERIAPLLVKRTKQHDSVKYTSASFKWAIKKGKAIESYHHSVSFITEWNYFDFHLKRWKWFGWLVKLPTFKQLFNNSIVHVEFDK